MKYLKTFEAINKHKKYILCKLDYKDRFDKNFKSESKEPVYVIFNLLKTDCDKYFGYDTELKIIYEYQNDNNFSDRRWDKINNIEWVMFDNIKLKIISQSNNSTELINNLKLIAQTDKFNL